MKNKYRLNKTFKYNKSNKYNYSIRKKHTRTNNLKGGSLLNRLVLSKANARINNIFKNFIVKLVKQSIPHYCKDSKHSTEPMYSEGTKLWNQSYKFSKYTSFLNSRNIYTCKNMKCGISAESIKHYAERGNPNTKKSSENDLLSKKDECVSGSGDPYDPSNNKENKCDDDTTINEKMSIKYKSIGLNSCINNLFVQTIIKHEISRVKKIDKLNKSDYAHFTTWKCLSTDKSFSKFIILPDNERIIKGYKQLEPEFKFSRFVSAKQFFEFYITSTEKYKNLPYSKQDLVSNYIFGRNLTHFLTIIFNSIDLLFKHIQFQHYNLTLDNIIIPVNDAFDNNREEDFDVNETIFHSFSHAIIYNFDKSAITINIQDIPFIKTMKQSGKTSNNCKPNYVRVRPIKPFNFMNKKYSHISTLFKSRFLPHSSNLPDKMVLIKSIADIITEHLGPDFLKKPEQSGSNDNLKSFIGSVNNALNNSKHGFKCVCGTINDIDTNSNWPSSTFSLIEDKMKDNPNALYFFEAFDIDKTKPKYGIEENSKLHQSMNKKNNNLYVIENLIHPMTPLSIYGKNGSDELTNLNLSNLNSTVSLLHDDNACNYHRYVDNPAKLNKLFSLGRTKIDHDDNFNPINTQTGLIDIYIPPDKKPGDLITIKDMRGEDIIIRVPYGAEPGRYYSAIHTHNSCENTECKIFGENNIVNFDLI